MIPDILPPLSVGILDAEEQWRDRLTRWLEDILPSLTVKAFAQSQEASTWLKQQPAQREGELAVLVTDRIGLCPEGDAVVDALHELFPRTRVVVHDDQIKSREELSQWLQEGLVHELVNKGNEAEFKQLLQKQLHDYEQDESLQSLRRYIATLKNPRARFYRAQNGQMLSMLDIYWEILRDTAEGQELRTTWKAIQTLPSLDEQAQAC